MALDKLVEAGALDKIVIDSGIVYKDYGGVDETIMGVTRGGNSFSVTPEYKEIGRDGAMGKEKGLKRLIGLEATLTVNLISLDGANVKDAIGGAAAWDDTSKVTSKITLADADFLPNVALIGETLDGEYVKITVFNALADNGFEISLVDKDEAVVEIEFSAHFDPQGTDYDQLFEVEYLATFPAAD